MELPIYRVTLADINQGVKKISLVENPAIEEEWFAFSEDEADFKLASEVEQKLIGALLVPDKKIFRNHPTKGKFNMVFSADVIEEIARRFNEDNLNNEFNVEHSTDVDGVSLSENWIVKDSEKDKSSLYGLKLPVGSWIGVAKIDSLERFNAVKDNLKGFSIEAVLKLVESNLSEEEDAPTDEEMIDWLSDKGELEADYLESEEWELIEEDDEEHLAIESKPNSPSKYDNENFVTRYKYIGGKPIPTTRKFCREMITVHKGMIFRHEDINQMSFRRENKEFKRYSIFKFKGSFGCRHRWKKLLFGKVNKKSNIKPKNPEGYSEARKLNKNIKLSSMELKIKFEAQLELEDGSVLFTPTGFKEGATIYVGENEEGSLATAGNYELPSGETLVVGEDGVVSELKAKVEEEELAEEETPKGEESEAMKAVVLKVAELEAKMEELEAKMSDPEGKESETEDMSSQIDKAVKVALSEMDGGSFLTGQEDGINLGSEETTDKIQGLKKAYKSLKNK